MLQGIFVNTKLFLKYLGSNNKIYEFFPRNKYTYRVKSNSLHNYSTMKGKVFILNKKFSGMPKESDFTLQEEELPALKDGEFLAQAVYLSVDPYMRSFSNRSGVGNSPFGEQVAKILESKNSKYPVGEYVIGDFGWRTHTVSSETRGRFFPLTPRILPPNDYKPRSLALGILGMPGNTAYFGFLNICKPKEGDVVVVSAAGGAVGSHVGQIAKIKGCYVIGITGTTEKCEWITKVLAFDVGINYKNPDFEQKLSNAVPEGIDCYFDNVGGAVSKIILKKMKKHARVAFCGSIATYNADKDSDPDVPKDKKLSVGGVNVFKHRDEWDVGINQNRIWLNEGKLKYRETITKGFENMPKAFIGMMQGGNIGKAIVEA